MAKSTKSDLNWQNVNIDTMPEDLRNGYAEYKQAYADMKEAREHFEENMRSALASETPKGKRIVFGYNFGKLSIALADDDTKPAPKASATSFASLLRK